MSNNKVIIKKLEEEVKELERKLKKVKTPKLKTFKITTTDHRKYETQASYADYFTTGVVVFKDSYGKTIGVVLNAKSVFEVIKGGGKK